MNIVYVGQIHYSDGFICKKLQIGAIGPSLTFFSFFHPQIDYCDVNESGYHFTNLGMVQKICRMLF
jgi:hypothetical protein